MGPRTFEGTNLRGPDRLPFDLAPEEFDEEGPSEIGVPLLAEVRALMDNTDPRPGLGASIVSESQTMSQQVTAGPIRAGGSI